MTLDELIAELQELRATRPAASLAHVVGLDCADIRYERGEVVLFEAPDEAAEDAEG